MAFAFLIIVVTMLACLAMAAVNASHLRDPVTWRKRRDSAKFSKRPAHVAAKDPEGYRHGARVRLWVRVAIWATLATLLVAVLTVSFSHKAGDNLHDLIRHLILGTE